MKTTKIYVVLDHVNYEGSRIIKAFKIEQKAEEFKRNCEGYHATRDWMAEPEEMSKWLDNHPAGTSAYSADGFRVETVELV